jgi:NADH-quinone oxidoreductase subunit K
MNMIHWLNLAVLLFSIGLYGALTRRNTVGILMSVELMLNAGALAFLIFSHFLFPSSVDGALMVVFIIAIAAAEAVVAMAIFVAAFKNSKTADVTRMAALRG